MLRVDPKEEHFKISRQGVIYEMTKHQVIDEYCKEGNIFKVNGKEVGLIIFDIKDKTLTIVNFDFTPFGDNRRKGYGKIFL